MYEIGKSMRLVSFIGMWAVVAHHCGCGSSLDRYFIPTFCHWAVPWFFMTSGFFFLSSYGKRSPAQFIVGKMKSLLVPFLLWCVIGWIAQTIEAKGVVERSTIKVFGLEGDNLPKFNGPCWFLRELMLLMVITAGATLMVGRLGFKSSKAAWCIAVVILCAWCGLKRIGLPIMFAKSAVFFCLGLLLSRKLIFLGGGGGVIFA